MGFWTSVRGIFRPARDTTPKVRQLAEGPPITPEQIRDHMAGMTRSERRDAWKNILTAVGTARDKREAGEFDLDPVSYQEAYDLWRGDDIAKRIIEALPKDGLRRGFDVKFDDKDQAEKSERALKNLGFARKFVLAGQTERAYGGAAIYPVINDSNSDLANPFDEESAQMPIGMRLYEPRELYPVSYYEAPTDAKWGEVEIWRIQPIYSRAGAPDPTEIHESRLIIFPGIRVSRAQPSGCAQGWGDSVLTVVRNVLRDYNLSWGAAILLLQEIKVGIFKMNKLGDLIEADKDDVVADRMMQVDLGKSIANSITIDKEDDYEIVTTPLTGASDILSKFEVRMGAAADMPVTKLLGQSPAGMNATGESDITIWDDNVMGWQDEHMPQMEQGVRFVLLANDGPTGGKEPENWSAEFRPLRTPTPKEQADLRYTVAQTDEIYYNMHGVSSDDVMRSHFGGDAYSPELHIDFAARDAMNNLPSPDETMADPEAMKALGRAGQVAPVGAEEIQKSALNGAQVASMVAVIKETVLGNIPRQSGGKILQLAFQLSEADATALLGPEDFEPAPAKPSPFAAPAAAPAKPADKPTTPDEAATA